MVFVRILLPDPDFYEFNNRWQLEIVKNNWIRKLMGLIFIWLSYINDDSFLINELPYTYLLFFIDYLLDLQYLSFFVFVTDVQRKIDIVFIKVTVTWKNFDGLEWRLHSEMDFDRTDRSTFLPRQLFQHTFYLFHFFIFLGFTLRCFVSRILVNRRLKPFLIQLRLRRIVKSSRKWIL